VATGKKFSVSHTCTTSSAPAACRALRRDKSFRPHETLGLTLFSHQPDVGQLGDAVHENDVRGLDVTMDQPVLVHVRQALRQHQRHFHARLESQPPLRRHFAPQGLWDVTRRIDLLTALHTIRHFHHVVEAQLSAANLRHVHQPLVRPRDGLELLDAVELALERPGVIERVSIHDLHSAVGAHDVACQPYLAVGTAPNAAQQLVAGDWRGWPRAGRLVPELHRSVRIQHRSAIAGKGFRLRPASVGGIRSGFCGERLVRVSLACRGHTISYTLSNRLFWKKSAPRLKSPPLNGPAMVIPPLE
jgi:hypothetical protein